MPPSPTSFQGVERCACDMQLPSRSRPPCWPPRRCPCRPRTPAPVLKKSAPPLRGTAELGFIQTAKLEGNNIVTTFQVKNMSATNAHRRTPDQRVLVRQGRQSAAGDRRSPAAACAAAAARRGDASRSSRRRSRHDDPAVQVRAEQRDRQAGVDEASQGAEAGTD